MNEPQMRQIALTVNGKQHRVSVEPRRTLLDCLRDDLVFPGTHVGCEHGVCGCCNVIVDGSLVRSCLMLAVQADGGSVETIEGIGQDGELSPMQEAFCSHHAMQCGYCTPGMIMTLEDLLRNNAQPTEDELVEAVSGNLCRCTGYQQILHAAREVIASASDRGATVERRSVAMPQGAIVERRSVAMPQGAIVERRSVATPRGATSEGRSA